VTWRQIFKAVLDPVGYTFVQEGNIIHVVRGATSSTTPPRPRLEAQPGSIVFSAPVEPSAGPVRDYVLQPGDVVTVRVFQHEELSHANLRLTTDSSLAYLPLGTVDLKNKTARQAEQFIREQLIATGVANPQVTLSFAEYQRRSPGRLSVDFIETHINVLLRNVAKLSHYEVFVPPSLQGKISLTMRDATWQEIFHAALTSRKYGFVLDGDTIIVFPLGESVETPRARF
jgi:hypothetical protein